MKQPLLRNALFMLAAVSMAAIPTKAFAHQVQTEYILNNPVLNPESEALELRTTFSNGEPLKGAKVSVYAPEQSFRPVTTGVTDSQGRFSFSPDASVQGDWEVKIQREGHGDILRVPVTEEGIDQASMARIGSSDTHYAGSPLMAVGSIAVAAACIGVAKLTGKKSVE